MEKLKKIPVKESEKSIMDNPSVSSYPPSFYVSSKQMSEIKDWEVGKKHKMMIEVEQKSMSEDDNNVISGNFDIVAYKVMDYNDMTDEEFEAEQGKAHSNY